MSYTDLATLKAYLGIPTATTTDDTLLTACIARAQAAIDAQCGGRTFEASADSTRYFDVMLDTDGLSLFFDEDLCAITTVTNNLDNGTGGVVVTSSQYTVLPRNETPYFGIKLKSSANIEWEYTSDPESAISVIGKWAYSTSAPNDIVQACIRWAAYLYRQKDAVVEVTASPDTGGYRIPAGVPEDVRDYLNPYIRRV